MGPGASLLAREVALTRVLESDERNMAEWW